MKICISSTLVTSFFSTSRSTSINHSKYRWDGQIQRKYTFLQATPEYRLVEVPNTRSFRIEAYGVTPIPPPTITAISNLYQSWLPPPKGPSILILGGLSLSSSLSLMVLSKLFLSFQVQGPTALMWTERKSSCGALVRVKEWNSTGRTMVQVNLIHWPDRTFMLGGR